MQRVEKEAARMGLLVEDLLLLARLDQQRPMARQPVDMLSLAADAVHDARLLAPARAIDLSVQPGAAFLVIGDEPRLRQVIGNLMSNALNHTPDGVPIEVSVGTGTLEAKDGKQTPAVVLDVTDQGPGMTQEQARRVFERFYRADQARARAHRRQRAGPGHRGLAGGRPRRRRPRSGRPRARARRSASPCRWHRRRWAARTPMTTSTRMTRLTITR